MRNTLCEAVRPLERKLTKIHDNLSRLELILREMNRVQNIVSMQQDPFRLIYRHIL